MSKIMELQAPNPEKSREERIADTKKHFVDIYGKIPAGQFLYLIAFSGGTKCYTFNTADESQLQAMAEKAIELSDSGVDVYHSVNSVSVKPTDNKRGDENVVSYQTAIVVDVDIQSDAHKQKSKRPTTFDVAKSFLPFKPSKLFNSGYGLHAYYIFDTPIKITADNRAECKRRNNRLLELVRQRAGQFAKAVDEVGDLPRVLRTPGTYNYKLDKDNPPLCHVVEDNDIRYTPDDIDAELNALLLLPAKETSTRPQSQETSTPKKSARQNTEQPTEQERAIAMLAFVPCESMTYEDWVQVGMILKNNGNTCSDWEKWSRNDDRFKDGECERKWSGFNRGGLTVATLHNLAQIFGYSEADFQRQWYHNRRRADTVNNLTAEQRKFLFGGDYSDDDFAKKIVHFYGKDFRYMPLEGNWYRYENGIWRNVGSKNSALFPYANDIAQKMEVNATDKDEFKMAKILKSTAKKSKSIAAIQGMREVFITADDLDNHAELFNVVNGVIDLQTGKLHPHAPELMLTQQSPAVYNVNARSADVDKFLEDIQPNEETRQALLIYLGYCMTGFIRDHKALFINGRGRNGKGTLLRLLHRTFGDNYFTTLSKGVVLKSPRLKDNNAPSPELMVLKKRRLAVVDEISDVHDVLDVTTLKTLTGGDTITARQLNTPYEQGGGITPTHHLILSGNRLPTIDNPNDIGLRERLLSVPFNADFSQNPDLTLDDRLSTADAISRFLSILVRAAQEYLLLTGGLIESAEMKESREEYLEANDIVLEFATEKCIIGEGGEITRKAFEDELRWFGQGIGRALPRMRKDLHEMILQSLKPLGVVYGKDNHNNNIYRNIKWQQTTN